MKDCLRTKVEGGWIEGKYSQDGRVRIFRGVPYAAPPIGELRWKAPRPVTPWEGIRETKYYASANMYVRPSMKSFYGKEFDQQEYRISEDCLYLNIWAPAAEKEGGYPAALWYHGGDAHANKAVFDGEGFARKGVILITVGFRTGPFAGFTHAELGAEAERENGHYTSGNYGLLDQIEAVKWVRRNIARFGGDAERITVFGQSAGGTAVQRLISTPLLKGQLFGAIMQSAGGLDPRYMPASISMEEGERQCRELLLKFGIQDIKEARKLPAEKIQQYFSGGPELNMAVFAPKPDGWSLLYTPEETSWRNLHHDTVHYMIGTTKHEGFAYTYNGVTAETLKRYLQISYGGRWEEYWNAAGAKNEREAQIIRRQDSGDVKMATCYSWVQLQNEQGRPGPFVYLFTKEAPGPEGVGAFHSGEHAYVFQNLDKVPWRPYSDCDRELSDMMSDYWANFMRTGDPNGDGLPAWDRTERMKEDPWIMELGLRVGMIRPEETKPSSFIRDYAYHFFDPERERR